MKMKHFILATGMLLALAVAAVASTVTPLFVGKGAVQEALGLNNAALQLAAPYLDFAYEEEVVLWVACEKETAHHVLENTFRRTREVSASVSYESRRNGQGSVTGFWLTVGEASGSGSLPSCPTSWDEVGRGQDEGDATFYVNGVPFVL
jgi:hypothetical protein